MKSPDEIKKGLKLCVNVPVGGPCPEKCPLLDLCKRGDEGAAQREILALIQQLQAENAEQADRIRQLEKRVIHLEALNQSNLSVITMQERTRDRLQEQISQLEAERDAAVDDLEDYATLKCFACKYYEMELTEAPCDECKIMGKGNRDMFEWRGVQKEE